MMSRIFEIVKPVYIENWNASLKELTISQTDIPLSFDETLALGQANKDFSKWFWGGPVGSLDNLRNRINEALKYYPDGAFVRLGSRSGKDSSYASNHGLKITDGNAAVRMLTEDTYRIAYDLRLALQNNYLPHVFIRQWYEIPPWAEFRCFMKNGNLLGISQYNCKDTNQFPQICQYEEKLKSAIFTFFEEFKSKVRLNEVIFDVFVLLSELNSNISVNVILLELNPFFSKTDPCLFTWSNNGDFDGSFRYIKCLSKKHG